MIVLAPAYGGGAVLIREAARRTGRGWPMMLMLGAAYTLIGEGLVNQSLFNPDYMQKHWHLLHPAYIPALGIGGWWTLLMFNLHTFWSMGVSIALVEALFPAEAEAPWLGLPGDSVVAAIFVLGAAANFAIGYRQNRFLATPAQFLGTAGLCLLLILLAFLIPRRRAQPADGEASSLSGTSKRMTNSCTKNSWMMSPWGTGAITFVLGMGVLHLPPRWGWGAVAAMLALDAVFLGLVAFFARQTGWSAWHTLSLAAGGALDYGIRALTAKPLMGGVLAMRISNMVFLAAALWLIWLATRRLHRTQTPA